MSSTLVLWRGPVPRRDLPPILSVPRRPILGGVAALALLLLVAGHHAAADFIDQYLPRAIAAFGEAPGVTVASRTRPDYDPLGIHLGGFIVRPTASEAVGFDSNPSGLAHPRGSALIESQAAIEANSDWTRNSLGAAVSVDDRRTPSQPQDDATQWTGSIGGTVDVGRDQGAWSFAHLSLSESPAQLDNGGFNRAIPYNINDARVAYRINFNRLSLEPALEYSTYRFAADIAGVPSQAYRNRDVLQPSLTARYELAPLRSLVAVARGTLIDYLTSLPGLPRRNSIGFTLLGGIDLGGDLLDARLLAGYQQRDYRSAVYGRIAQPVVESSLAWTPTPVATFTGRLSRTIEDAADETTVGYTQSEADIAADYEFRRNVLLHAEANLQIASFGQSGSQGGGGTTTQVGATAGATWLLNRGVSVSGTYTYLNNRSDKTVSYDDHLALLRLGLKL